MVFVIDSAASVMSGRSHITLPDATRFETAIPASSTFFAQGTRARHMTEQLARRLPAGTEIRIESTVPPNIWVKLPQVPAWIVTPLIVVVRTPPGLGRILPALLVVLGIALAFSLFVAWQLQRPVRAMAEAAEKLATRREAMPLKERGPLELRQLTERFNRMTRDIVQADRERNTMLAGIAHDLKTPLSRLRLRAEMIDDTQVSTGITRDVEAMARIVDQFLIFARGAEADSPSVAVDERLPFLVQPFVEQGYDISVVAHAGTRFKVKATHLERMLNNLLDNAVTYGRAPIVVSTGICAEGWRLSVEDHGNGIPEADLQRIARPFVRLDPARSGNAHCGLGLAIVDKLARQLGGRLLLENRPQGGLKVSVIFTGRDDTA